MRLARSSIRLGFSLLEMVLALALGMLLLLALYVAFETYIGYSQSGRDAANEGALARNIFARITSDITGQLSAKDPRLNEYPAATATADMPTMVESNSGVYGQPGYVMLTSFRVRKPLNVGQPMADNTPQTSDVSRIFYWIAKTDNSPGGLARKEFKQATSPDADVEDPAALPNQSTYIVAPEVKNIEFTYYDGVSPTPLKEWDGVTVEVEGTPPPGPPAAIGVRLTFRKSFDATSPEYNVDGASYQHIVALPTSNSFAPPTKTQ